MKIIRKTLIVSLLVSSTIATSVFAAPSVNELKDGKAVAQQEMQELENQLDSLVKKINNLEIEMVETGKAVIEATEDLEQAEIKEKEQYEAAKRCIIAMYENGSNALMRSVFETGSIADMLKRAETVQAIHTYEKEQLQAYIETKQKVAELKMSLEEDMERMEAMQADYADEKKSLDRMIVDKTDEIEDFEAKIQDALAAVEEERRQQSAQSNHNGNVSNGYVPPSGTGGGQAIVNAAYQYLGVPYVWGGASSSGVDCSGLVLLAHKVIGVNLSHYSGSQGSGGKRIASMAEALPGDVVCYVGHVGIYLGGGQMIHAPQEGDVVRVVNVYGSPWFRRYW